MTARQLGLQSTGVPQEDSWLLSDNGYVGGYLRVPVRALVRLTVHAQGHEDQGSQPHMVVALAGQHHTFEVGARARDYTLEQHLEAGVYFIRIDYTNDTPNASRELTIHSLSALGAELLADNSDELALAAADTLIEHYRTGKARVSIAGARAGDKVRVSLVQHAFNFGTNIPYAENKLIPTQTPPGSDAARFQQMVLGRFNTVVLSNGGKWMYHEGTRDRVDLEYVDRFLEFAEQHQLRARMHTMLWDAAQEPAWVSARDSRHPGLLTRAAQGDDKARAELSAEIDERIRDYVQQRASGYVELDVLNESLHRPRYVQAYSTQGIADIFNRTASAVSAAGATTRLYLNEYNLFQWSEHPLAKGPDPYANWYRRHAEELLRAGARLDGLGIQYYPDGRSRDEIGSDAHSPARIMQVLQNLAGTGLRLSLTEFAVRRDTADAARAADILEDTLRLVFGMPEADSFLIWAIWENAAQPPPSSVLFDKDSARTVVGERYDQLMQRWHTELETTLDADAAFEFTGFWGDYVVTLGDASGRFSLRKGETSYNVRLADTTP